MKLWRAKVELVYRVNGQFLNEHKCFLFEASSVCSARSVALVVGEGTARLGQELVDVSVIEVATVKLPLELA